MLVRWSTTVVVACMRLYVCVRYRQGPVIVHVAGDESTVVPAGELRLQVVRGERAGGPRDAGRPGATAGAPLVHQRPRAVHRQRGHAAYPAPALRHGLRHHRRRQPRPRLPRPARRRQGVRAYGRFPPARLHRRAFVRHRVPRVVDQPDPRHARWRLPAVRLADVHAAEQAGHRVGNGQFPE